MKIFLANGTIDYLKSIVKKHEDKNLILLKSEDNALIVHETDEKSVFNYPRSFHVLQKRDQINLDNDFFVIEYLPTLEDWKKVLGHQFNKADLNFPAIRDAKSIHLLEQVNGNNFAILSTWESKKQYLEWKERTKENYLYDLIFKSLDFTYRENLFIGLPYAAEYKVYKEEEESN